MVFAELRRVMTWLDPRDAELAASGKAILMISSELSELLTACDRIVVMADGRAHDDIPHSALHDATEVSSNAAHRIQVAEQRLQIAIQDALSAGQEVSNVHR